ncbi:MAG: hypothetical protein ACREIT_05825 [Tepidisphaeraceae bacterium]
MLNRGTIVYVVMMLAFGAGLWVIIGLGTKLTPPEDLAGDWELEPAGTGVSEKVTLVQSGRYFNVRFKNRDSLDLKLVDQKPGDDEGEQVLTLKGVDASLVLEGKTGGDEYEFALESPEGRSHWVARRTARRYTEHADASKPQAPPATGTPAPTDAPAASALHAP